MIGMSRSMAIGAMIMMKPIEDGREWFQMIAANVRRKSTGNAA